VICQVTVYHSTWYPLGLAGYSDQEWGYSHSIVAGGLLVIS
jgi:hypothetical protein